MIRPTVDTDGAALKVWLSEKGILAYFPMCNEAEVVDSIRLWLSFISKNAAFTYEKDGEVAGMAVIYLQPFEKHKHIALFAIIVDPRFRGQGIGSKLIRHLEKAAKNDLGLVILHLEVYEGNPAYELYKRLGYKEYGKQKRFLRDAPDKYSTKVCMQKEL